MAASGNWGVLVVGALLVRALLLGIYVRAHDVYKTPM